MKKDLHPKLHKIIFRDKAAGVDFVTTSTMTSDHSETVDGVEYYVVNVEISAASHPFYTGKQKLIDTAGKVDKFRARMEKADATPVKTTKISESVRLAAGKKSAVGGSALAAKKLVSKVKADNTKRELARATVEGGEGEDSEKKAKKGKKTEK